MPTNNITYVVSVAEGMEVKGEVAAKVALIACALEIKDLRKYIVRILDGNMEEKDLPRTLLDALDEVRDDEKRERYNRR